jgi:hypothetical protein
MSEHNHPANPKNNTSPTTLPVPALCRGAVGQSFAWRVAMMPADSGERVLI